MYLIYYYLKSCISFLFVCCVHRITELPCTWPLKWARCVSSSSYWKLVRTYMPLIRYCMLIISFEIIAKVKTFDCKNPAHVSHCVLKFIFLLWFLNPFITLHFMILYAIIIYYINYIILLLSYLHIYIYMEIGQCKAV